MTASGDGTAHIWKYVVLSHVLGGASSEESPDSESEDTDAALGKRESRSAVANTIKAPIIALTGHQGVVSGCEWLNDELCVTSSWDRYVVCCANYRTGAIISRSRFEADLIYKPRILSLRNEEFPFLVHKLSAI